MSAQASEIQRLFGNSIKSQAAMLLGRNISESQAASILGVSPALISQYKEDELFREQVRLMQIDTSLAASLRDEKINEIEDSLLDRTLEILPYITRPMEVIGVLKTINSLQRRGAVVPPVADSQTATVVLDLPAFAKGTSVQVSLQFSQQNEVIEVDGRILQTMPASAVARMAARPALEHGEETTDEQE